MARNKKWLFVFMGIYALGHIPFLFTGFGEPDGWRNGLVALRLAKGLGYIPVRFPGFPVIDVIYGMMATHFPWESLWIYTNLLTLMITLVGIFYYFKIVHFHNISCPLATVSLLFFMPIIFVNASSSMDYLWTVTFILIAYWFLLRGKAVIGGIFLGMAIGTRLTTGIMGLPFLIFLIRNPDIFHPKIAFRSAFLFVFSAVTLSVGWYLPIFVKYQFGMFSILFIPRDFLRSGYYILQEFLGLPGTIMLLMLLVSKRKEYRRWNWELSLWSTIIIAYLTLFLIKTEKVAYLIPMLPFMSLWIARWLGGKSVTILTSLVVFNNILSFLVIQPSTTGLEMKWASKGMAWQKYNAYRSYLQDADYFIHYRFQPDSRVIAGWHFPGIAYQLECPTYKTIQADFLANKVTFSYGLEKEKRKNIYLVQGTRRLKRSDPIWDKVIILHPPSTLERGDLGPPLPVGQRGL
ncbi:MAG: hypothetical protein V2B13_03045 [Pseudomonadota bacterium]